MTVWYSKLKGWMGAVGVWAMFILWPAVGVGWFEVPDRAESRDVVHEGKPRVETQLVTDVQQVASGSSFRVGVAFDLDTDWHIYWQNPGDAGLPTDIEWSAEQVDFGPLKWAAPERFTESDGALTVFGYADRVILFSQAKVSQEAAGSVDLSVKVDYLACSEACMPGAARLERSIPLGEETIPADHQVLSALEKYSSRVPRPTSRYGLESRIQYSKHSLIDGGEFEAALAITCGDAGEACADWKPAWDHRADAFVTGASSRADVTVERVQRHPGSEDGWVFQLVGTVDETSEPSEKDILSGVLRFRDASGTNVPIYIKHPLPPRGPPQQEAERDRDLLSLSTPEVTSAERTASGTASSAGNIDSVFSIFWMLGLAFLGGMILNLMPCVFPVLALKVTSFTEIVQESRRSIWTHGAAYTAGIVVSMAVLALVVIGLQIAGHQVGWGFQFQQPVFPAVLAAVVTLFSLNLFGVFDVTVDANELSETASESKGVTRSAAEGVLAVVLATPCSAPFLGTAVGFAFASGWMTILSVFVALGLGLAAPFVVLTLMPGWAEVLPRPGAWMGHLKHGLGFALVGTAVWLLWLVGQQAGVNALVSVLSFLVVLSFSAWMFGLVQYSRSALRKWAVIGAAAAVLVGAGWATLPSISSVSSGETSSASSASNAEEGGIDWERWSPEKVRSYRQNGQPVFVDFTADWCVTCQVNERRAISTEAVRQAADKYNVAMLKADWTDGSERIRQALQRHDRAGVPLYVVYPPGSTGGQTEPWQSSGLLSEEQLVKSFRRAASPRGQK